MSILTIMRRFQNVFSVSGGENALADTIEELLDPVADEIRRDAVGNLIVFKKGVDGSKKLMTASHMDEIGFVATASEENGMVRVSNLGGINPVASSYSPVRFQNGVRGVLIVEDGTKPEDISNKKLFVDIGASTAAAALRKVPVGELCAVEPKFVKLSANRYSSKAFDDRIGCAINAFVALNTARPKYDTYFVFTVQEEVGCRGSKPASFGIMPDYSIALDITPAPAVGNPNKLTVRLGDGAAIKIKDSSVICSPLIVDRLTELAKEESIKYQYEVLVSGGTDTSSMQTAGEGSLAGCISIPTRYTHTPVETLDLRDVEACCTLLKAFVERGI